MNKPLANPTSENGLLAYYRFNSLKNLQGNSSFDGVLSENTIVYPATVPSCQFASDPCPKCTLTASFDVLSDKCNPAHFDFSNMSQGATTYLWQFGDNTTPNATTKDAAVTYKSAGDYDVTLEASDGNGCSDKVSQTVAAALLPKIITTEPTTVCKGASIQLESSITDADAQYAWTPALPPVYNPTATMEETTTFALSVTKSNGCVYGDAVTITVPDPVTFSITPEETSVCPHSTVVLTATGGDTYQWTDGKGAVVGTASTLSVSPETSETYTLSASSTQCGESETLSSQVNVFPLSTFAIQASNDINCGNTSAVLHIEGDVFRSVQWTPATGLTDKGQTAVITPKTTSTYSAKIEDQNGCMYDATYTQTLYFDPSGVHFFAPSAFTPNGDGKNDIFKIQTDVAVSSYILRIFNRYGQLVFQTQRSDQGWDGRMGKEVQPTGTYAYEIVAKSNFCGEFYKKGIIVLIR
ncbi:MAG: gliding motility-associated C-terminal domain-containing protein [Chitinophagaceae bacterium]